MLQGACGTPPPSGGWVGGKVPFLHSSSSSGFKHSTLCCSFDTMSNNHEFYLDHKKKHRQQTDKWTDRGLPGVGRGGTTGPRRRPSTLNKCFSFLSSLCCLYVCLPFLRCCFFFYFFFVVPLFFILFFYYASALKDTNAGHGGDWRRPMPSRTPVVPFVCQPRLGRICGHVIAH